MTTINIPIERYPRAFRQFRDQIPFATSVALNKTAWDKRDELKRGGLRKHLTLRNAHTERGIRVEKSTKHTLRAEVGSIDWYMERQVVGGTQRPKIGIRFNGKSYLLTPTAALRGKTGRLKRQPTDKPAFIFKADSGKIMLARRKYKRKRMPLVILGFLDEEHGYDKKVPWEKMVDANIEQIFGRHWKRAMVRSIRTAR